MNHLFAKKLVKAPKYIANLEIKFLLIDQRRIFNHHAIYGLKTVVSNSIT